MCSAAPATGSRSCHDGSHAESRLDASVRRRALQLEAKACSMRWNGLRFEQGTRAAEAMRLVIDAIPTMAWTVRPDGVVDFVNLISLGSTTRVSLSTRKLQSRRARSIPRRTWPLGNRSRMKCACGRLTANIVGFWFAHPGPTFTSPMEQPSPSDLISPALRGGRSATEIAPPVTRSRGPGSECPGRGEDQGGA